MIPIIFLLVSTGLFGECVFSRNVSKLQEVGVKYAHEWKLSMDLSRWNGNRSVFITSRAWNGNGLSDPFLTMRWLCIGGDDVTMSRDCLRSSGAGVGAARLWTSRLLGSYVCLGPVRKQTQDGIMYARISLGKMLLWEKIGRDPEKAGRAVQRWWRSKREKVGGKGC